jgi:PhnB protein
MSMPKPIPDMYRRITPTLIVDGGVKALEFYAEVFGATERMRFPGPDGNLAHAEIQIGDSIVIIEDASPNMGTQPPPREGLAGTPNSLFIYVEDLDATIEHAVKLGATLKRAPQDQFCGDRDGHIIDPFGHAWTIATHVEGHRRRRHGQQHVVEQDDLPASRARPPVPGTRRGRTRAAAHRQPRGAGRTPPTPAVDMSFVVDGLQLRFGRP